MIGWLILIFVTLVLSIVLWFRYNADNDADSVWQIPATICSFICFIFILITVIASLVESDSTRAFITDKAYYEIYSTLPKSGWRDEDYNVQDANEWLMHAKASREVLGIFSLYPAKVEQLEPIK